MITISMEVDNKVSKTLKSLDGKLKDFSVPMKLAGLYMLGSIDENFRKEGRPKKWKPLSKFTLDGRRGGSKRILQDTGTLRRSITMHATKTQVKVGTSYPWARRLQFGGVNIMPERTIRPVNTKALRFIINGKEIFAKSAHIPEVRMDLPSRPFIVFQKEDYTMVEKIFGDHIDKGLKE